MSKYCLVIPCFNEERRLHLSDYLAFVNEGKVSLCFVNDGSSDGTLKLLTELSLKHENIEVLNLEKNMGKGEAIREGILHCLEKDYSYIGYWDADLATPLTEVEQFLDILSKGYSIVMGSRILRMGGDIQRKWYRHYLGRVFATVVSMVLGIPLYDSQCGAKFFSMNDCKSVFDKPFSSQWLFDVEILYRLKKMNFDTQKYYEVPLTQWKDEDGSNLTLFDFIKAPFELLVLFWKYK